MKQTLLQSYLEWRLFNERLGLSIDHNQLSFSDYLKSLGSESATLAEQNEALTAKSKPYATPQWHTKLI